MHACTSIFIYSHRKSKKDREYLNLIINRITYHIRNFSCQYMIILISIDDTDTKESRGTGRLARAIAGELSSFGCVSGVTRHQLLVHPDIPYTSHNSCAVIHLDAHNGCNIPQLVQTVRDLMLEDFIAGSDPGLAVGSIDTITPDIVAFGHEAKHCVLTQDDAIACAKRNVISLLGLGGTCGGVIGALAGLGLAASGNDGRYVLKGRLRGYTKQASVSDLLSGGIDEIRTIDGTLVESGIVTFRKFPKPGLRGSRAVLFVEEMNECYHEVVKD